MANMIITPAERAREFLLSVERLIEEGRDAGLTDAEIKAFLEQLARAIRAAGCGDAGHPLTCNCYPN